MDIKSAIQGVKGVKDITPEKIGLWRNVEAVAIDIFELYNFKEMRAPIFERTEVFKRSIGETTDIVEKEMYTFTDRGGESLTLRPEGTASIVRAFVEHKMYDPPGVTKLYYMGPMFRAERPQAGRFRQFHQVGAEVFGSADPAVDAELIVMLMDFFSELNVTDLKVNLNSLGCSECRPSYRNALYTYLKERSSGLCENCQGRIERNPLRALDCKSEKCKAVTAEAPTIDKYRCQPCQDHLEGVRRPLIDLETQVTIDPKLVRGLDYYSRTAFEVTSGKLGAQNAVAGGGRYDNLVEQFGGPKTPAIGFAVGLERLISIIEAQGSEVESAMFENRPDIFMIPMTSEAAVKVFELAHRFRAMGYGVDRAFDGGNMKSLMRRADRSGARVAVIIGEDELKSGSATIKNLSSGEQRTASFVDLGEALDEELEESV
ncbi:MAG: histidine--tRNA ligase [Nitrospinae bacterium]|nr:histidine--tRNA ligase [Nitrospinota bacterium]